MVEYDLARIREALVDNARIARRTVDDAKIGSLSTPSYASLCAAV